MVFAMVLQSFTVILDSILSDGIVSEMNFPYSYMNCLLMAGVFSFHAEFDNVWY